MENPIISLTNNVKRDTQKYNIHDFIKVVPNMTNSITSN